MKQRPIVSAVVVLALAGSVYAQSPGARLGGVRAIHILDFAEALGSERKLAICLMEKMQAQGPFTFPETREGADALLTLESTVPGGAKRGLLGRSPEVKATVTTPDGAVLWQGENKYKKSTTLWGGSTDIECGLANGLVDKLVKALVKARQAR